MQNGKVKKADENSIFYSGLWLPGSSPKISNVATLDFQEIKDIGENRVNVTVGVDASSLSAIFLRARGENRITSWTFSKSVPETFNQTFFISVANGIDKDQFRFDLTVEFPKGSKNGPMIDLTFVSIIYDDEKSYTADFKNLLKRFPDWTFPIHAIASVTSYVI